MPKKKKRKKIKKRKSSRKKRFKVSKDKKTQNSELIYKTKSDWVKKATVNKSGYEKKYTESIKNNEKFWKKEGKRITWIKPYTKVKDYKYSRTDVHIKWF